MAASEQVFSIPFRYLWNTNFAGDLEIHGEHSAEVARFVGDERNRSLRIFSDDLFQPFLNKTDKSIWPVTLFGPSGTGKTSLALTIISGISDRQTEDCLTRPKPRTSAKPIVLSASDFDRRFRTAIETDSVPDFRRRLLGCYGMVIDDLHQLTNKVAVQKELLQLIDQLTARVRPLVLTIETDPHQCNGLMPQLRSRLCGGLCLPVNAPGRDARRVIIRDLCKINSLEISPAAQDLLVNRLCITVPRIVGFFGQLQSLLRAESNPKKRTRIVDTDMINSLFGRSGDDVNQFSSTIIKLVSRELQLKPGDLRGNSRKQSIVQARAIAIFLHRRLLGMTFWKIGTFFGKRDHSTVMHAHRKIERLLNEAQPKNVTDPSIVVVRNKVEKLEQSLTNRFAAKISFD